MTNDVCAPPASVFFPESPCISRCGDTGVFSKILFQFAKKTARAAEGRDDASAMSGWAAGAVAMLEALLC